MNRADRHRRQLLGASMVTALGALMPVSAALLSTPAQSRGPFYPTQEPLDSDNDLVKVDGVDRQAGGSICDLRGRVLDINGAPVSDAIVEIWQCDAKGRYRHPGDRANRSPDEAFQGFGKYRTANDGHYRFRTIRPVPYPGRTPHIHFSVSAPGRPALVTQLYIEGYSGNEHDFLFQRIPADQRHLVTASFLVRPTAEAQLLAEFDLVLP